MSQCSRSGERLKARWRQQGVGLVEVLVSILVIALGLLGLAALQGKAQRAELASYQRSQALMLLQAMASRVQADHLTWKGLTQEADCPESSDWESQLISGTCKIAPSGDGLAVTVTWKEATNPKAGAGDLREAHSLTVPILFYGP